MKIYSVEQCGKMISATLKKDYVYRNITVRGTIYGLHTHFTGITFFTLMEGNYRISCFIGRAHHTFLTRNLMGGMEASVVGDLRYNEVRGCPVLYVSRILKVSESAEKKKLGALEEKLGAAGYFDPARKKRLPRFPFHIGIITSGSGAVIHDIMKTGAMRNPVVRYSLYNTGVQGETAAEDMAAGIREANRAEDRADILILARGGGAEEDLTPFNEEILLDAIHQSVIPIISAVGHETDVTLADRVADVRASTPTQAAEIAVPLLSDMKAAVLAPLYSLHAAVKDGVDDGRAMVNGTLRGMRLSSPDHGMERQRSQIFLLYGNLRDRLNADFLTAYRSTGDRLVRLMEGWEHGQ